MSLDFSNQNLRGRSFKGQDLTGANFSGADIRGANFEKATLVKADFRKARTGKTYSTAIIRGIGLFLTSSSLTFVAVFLELFIVVDFATELPATELKLSLSEIYQIGIATLLFILFLGISYLTLTKGVFFSLILVAVAVALTVVVAGAGALAGALAVAAIGAVALAVAGAVAGALAVSAIGAVALAVAGAVALAAAPGAIDKNLNFTTIVILIEGTVFYLLYFGYLIWRVRKEDERFAGIRQFGIALNAYGSTNFRNADLTEAQFSEAILKHARFLDAITTRTCWQNAKKLETANLKGTLLEKRAIRQLLVTGNGQNQSFAGLNLKGAYLANANLQNVDFTEMDLIGADLRGANFTGACLENWLIDSTTLLDNAHADYVYLLRNQQERRPASGVFGEGEFAKLFQEVLNTVDFIFKNGIDWKAFLTSFEKLRVQYGETEVSVRSIEDKGDGVFVVKVNVPPEANKAEFHQEFKQKYENELKLLETKYQAQLVGKEEVITVYRQQNTDLMQIIHQQAQKPIEIHNVAKAESNMSDAGNKTITIGDVDNRGGVFTIADLMKDVSNSINQLPETTDSQPGLKELLIQFQTLILQTSEEELPEEVKKLALEQLKMLAQTSTEPTVNKTKVQMLLGSLKGIIAHLPTAVVAHGVISAVAHFFNVPIPPGGG